METILTFEFNPAIAQWKHGKFEITDLTIIGSEEDQNIEYEDIALYLDDELYTGGISTFTENNISTDTLFDSVLSSYLRNNTEEYTNFGDGWEIFKSIEALKEWDGNLIVKLPVYDYDLQLYELQLATPSGLYYTCYDYCMILSHNGKLLTDIEGFYFSSYAEEIANILQGKERCLYMSEATKEWIEDYGKENIIEEYGS